MFQITKGFMSCYQLYAPKFLVGFERGKAQDVLGFMGEDALS
jgi:hypothetical protein